MMEQRFKRAKRGHIMNGGMNIVISIAFFKGETVREEDEEGKPERIFWGLLMRLLFETG